MAAHRKRRGALALYGVLLVLPTLALGLLQWRNIAREHEDELASVPSDAEDAARRFREAFRDEVGKLLATEELRGVEQYANYYCPDSAAAGDVVLMETQLRTGPRPEGVLAWFTFDVLARDGDGSPAGEVQIFGGSPPPPADELAGYQLAALDLFERFQHDTWLRALTPIGSDAARLELPVRAIAASRAVQGDEDCIEAERMLLSEPVRMVAGRFELRFYVDGEGQPRLIAHRRVQVDEIPSLDGATHCLYRVSKGLAIVQGFFVDLDWYSKALPAEIARRVLTKRERFLEAHDPRCENCAEYHADLRPIGDFDVDCAPENADWGMARIAIDTTEIDSRYRARVARFLAMAAMLLAALGTGMALLWRSVEKDLEQAERTENFVAAVTHELRTPLSSIKLHAEMLLEGWTTDPAKQREYYRRIVRETERLSAMVERVLEKAKLSSGAAKPEPCDLNELVDQHVSQLLNWRTTDEPDLAFELPDGLPLVRLTSEALHSILVNLVENARKYAGVDTAKPNWEPIVIATAQTPQGVTLEVRDRGPGVPPSQREHIFDAFYRVGSESTRTTRGAGLGLHLVALHAESVGARVEVLDRPGGGSIFRVTFRPVAGA